MLTKVTHRDVISQLNHLAQITTEVGMCRGKYDCHNVLYTLDKKNKDQIPWHQNMRITMRVLEWLPTEKWCQSLCHVNAVCTGVGEVGSQWWRDGELHGSSGCRHQDSQVSLLYSPQPKTPKPRARNCFVAECVPSKIRLKVDRVFNCES